VSAKEAPPLVKEKQPILGLYVTASEAYETWKAAPDTVKVLDVRTPDELLSLGHAPMAWNVPVAVQTFQWDAAKKPFPVQPLPDFVERARKIADGYEGDTVKDPGSVFDGQHMVNGWRNSDLPWTYDVDPARIVLPPGR
jgi:hypothetical protein